MNKTMWLLCFLAVLMTFPVLAGVVTNPNAIYSIPTLSKPGYLTPTTDPTFETRLERIVGNSGDTITFSGGGSGVWGADVRHHYQTDQPWNSDGTMLMLQNYEGSATPDQLILDGNTYEPKLTHCGNYSNSDDRWHPSLGYPNIRINVNGTSLEWFDVVACSQTRSWTLPFAHTNDFEMGPSQDGRFIALGSGSQAFVVDMDPQSPLQTYAQGNRRIGTAATINNCGFACTVDSINISPRGNYVLVRYSGDFQRVFDVNPSTLALTPHVYAPGTPECSSHDPANGFIFDIGHSDMGLNPFDGNAEVIVGQNRDWCPQTVNGSAIGQIYMIKLSDGSFTNLTTPGNEAQAYHVSMRAFDRQSYAYASYWPGNGERFNDEIMAVKLDGSGSVERFAHDHTDTEAPSECYRCESHPVPSRDGMRILFASSWTINDSGTQANPQAYIVDTRLLRPAGGCRGRQLQ